MHCSQEAVLIYSSIPDVAFRRFGVINGPLQVRPEIVLKLLVNGYSSMLRADQAVQASEKGQYIKSLTCEKDILTYNIVFFVFLVFNHVKLFRLPTSDGLQPTSHGLQPTSDQYIYIYQYGFLMFVLLTMTTHSSLLCFVDAILHLNISGVISLSNAFSQLVLAVLRQLPTVFHRHDVSSHVVPQSF